MFIILIKAVILLKSKITSFKRNVFYKDNFNFKTGTGEI